MTPQEALDQIAALCKQPSTARPSQIRAILAGVAPVPPQPSTSDRQARIDYLTTVLDTQRHMPKEQVRAHSKELSELRGEVPQPSTFPRGEILGALVAMWDDGNATGLDGWEGAGIGAKGEDPEATRRLERILTPTLDRIAALWPVPVPPPTVDRDALIGVVRANVNRLQGDRVVTDDEVVDRVLALLRPAAGAVGLDIDERMSAAVAIRESTLNEAMGYEHRKYLHSIAEKLEATT